MKKSFSFVFMGVMGFAAALGAASFGTSTINFDDSDLTEGAVSEPLNLDGFVLTGENVSIFDQGDNNLALQLATSNAQEDTASVTFDAARSSSVSADSFFTIEKEDGSAFEFISARFGGTVFDGDGENVVVTAIGSLFGASELTTFGSVSLPGGFSAGDQIFASSFDPASGTPLSGSPLSSLSFGVSSGGSGDGDGSEPVLAALDLDEIIDEETVTVDDVELASPEPVPVPASALLLGTALVGAGVWGRRKKKS